MAVILGRLCTICSAQGITKPATHVASNVVLQWYECDHHGPDDYAKAFNGGEEMKRTKRESAEEYFKRHFPGIKP